MRSTESYESAITQLWMTVRVGLLDIARSLAEIWVVSRLEMFFFFFQAEDGIRDVAVTGVQTCALPISLAAAQLGGWAAEPVPCAPHGFDTVAGLAELLPQPLDVHVHRARLDVGMRLDRKSVV